jgi:hypothetical protein
MKCEHYIGTLVPPQVSTAFAIKEFLTFLEISNFFHTALSEVISAGLGSINIDAALE